MCLVVHTFHSRITQMYCIGYYEWPGNYAALEKEYEKKDMFLIFYLINLSLINGVDQYMSKQNIAKRDISMSKPFFEPS